MIFVTFISFYSTELIVCAEEISDAYKHWKNEASYTNAFDYALFSGSETDSFVTNANSFDPADVKLSSIGATQENELIYYGSIRDGRNATLIIKENIFK